MNQENSFGPLCASLAYSARAAGARSGWSSSVAASSAAPNALRIAKYTPEENTGSMKANASPSNA